MAQRSYAKSVQCPTCDTWWPSPDARYFRLCKRCTKTVNDDGTWITGEVIILNGSLDFDADTDYSDNLV